jgi:hypothetical protein
MARAWVRGHGPDATRVFASALQALANAVVLRPSAWTVLSILLAPMNNNNNNNKISSVAVSPADATAVLSLVRAP